MAKIGLNNFRYAILTESADGTSTYDGAKSPGKAVSCNVEISNNEAALYADDVLVESDTSFQSGTVTIGIDEEDLETMATLLGHEISVEGVLMRSSDDIAPYVGLGHVVTKMVNGEHKYKAEFLNKVKFSEPSAENNEGTISALANGYWSEAKTFDTKEAAIEFLENLMKAPDGGGSDDDDDDNDNNDTP